ncbi:HU family DNA-binding protein [Acidobacteria bacterium AH-259-A15]|nr:HU family DNA-binding protein [Acidobacteria bacterium AH-259-A15]
MNKAELVAKTSKTSGVSKKDAAAVINALFDSSRKGVISGELRARQKVTIPGFGTFEARRRKARKGRNPQTGKEIRIKAKTVPAFRAGKGLRDSVGK